MGSSLLFTLNLLLYCFYCFGKSFNIFYSFEFYLLAFKLPILFFFFFFLATLKFFVCLLACFLSPVVFRFCFIVVSFCLEEKAYGMQFLVSVIYLSIFLTHFFTIVSLVIFGLENFVHSLAVPSGEAYNYNNIFKHCHIEIYFSVTFVFEYKVARILKS